eukprot:scaffold1922_cov101-Isochrysis_galbana.AAC.7
MSRQDLIVGSASGRGSADRFTCGRNPAAGGIRGACNRRQGCGRGAGAACRSAAVGAHAPLTHWARKVGASEAVADLMRTIQLRPESLHQAHRVVNVHLAFHIPNRKALQHVTRPDCEAGQGDWDLLRVDSAVDAPPADRGQVGQFEKRHHPIGGGDGQLGEGLRELMHRVD